MCGMDVDLDDGGSGEEEKEEEFWMGEGVKMLPPPVAHSRSSVWGSRRGRCGCLAWGAALILWNLGIVAASALLLALVFSVVLLPSVLLLYAGFLCHSRVSYQQLCSSAVHDPLWKRTQRESSGFLIHCWSTDGWFAAWWADTDSLAKNQD